MATLDPRKQFGNQQEQQVINPQIAPTASPELAGFAARSVMEGYSDMSRALTGITQNIENAVKTEEKTRLRAYESSIKLADAETTLQIKQEEMDSGTPFNAEQLKQRKKELMSTRVGDGYANGNFYFFKDDAAELKDVSLQQSLLDFEHRVVYPRVVDNVIANTVKSATDAQTEAYARLRGGDITGALEAFNRSRQEYQQGPYIVAAGRAQAQAKALEHDKQILDGLRAELPPEQYLELTRPAVVGATPEQSQPAGALAGLADADIQAKLRYTAQKELEHNIKAKEVEEAARVKLASDIYSADFSSKLSKAQLTIANGGTPNWKELRSTLDAISPYLDVGDRARAEAALDNHQAQYITAKKAQASLSLDSGIFDGKERSAMESTIQSGKTLEDKVKIQNDHIARSSKPYVSPRLVGELKELALQGNKEAIGALQKFRYNEAGVNAVNKIPGLNQFLEAFETSAGDYPSAVEAYKNAQARTPINDAQRKEEFNAYKNSDQKALKAQIFDTYNEKTKGAFKQLPPSEQNRIVAATIFRAESLHKNGNQSPEAYINQSIAIESSMFSVVEGKNGSYLNRGPSIVNKKEELAYVAPFVNHVLNYIGKPISDKSDVRLVHDGSDKEGRQRWLIEVRGPGKNEPFVRVTDERGFSIHVTQNTFKEYMTALVNPKLEKSVTNASEQRKINKTRGEITLRQPQPVAEGPGFIDPGN